MTVYECLQRRTDFFRDKWMQEVSASDYNPALSNKYRALYESMLVYIAFSTLSFLSLNIDAPDEVINQEDEGKFFSFLYSSVYKEKFKC